MAWAPGTGSLYMATILVLVVLAGVDLAGGGEVWAEVGEKIQLYCPGEGRGGCR